jgi:predicted amidohydrolase
MAGVRQVKTFRLAAVSLNPKPADLRGNGAAILDGIDRASAQGAQLVLFSEGILSGYDLDHLSEGACAIDSPFIRPIKERAKALNIHVSVGFLEKSGGDYYVSQMYAGPEYWHVYRKCHLTEHEKKCCKPGESLHVEDLGFVKVGTQICYDSAFSRASETLVRRGAELLFTPTGHSHYASAAEPRDYPSALEHRRQHVLKYWRARAYEFSCYAVYLDAVGETSAGEWYPGYIGIFGPDGEIIAENCTGQEALVCVDLDANRLAYAREHWIGHYQALADARSNLYEA